MDGNEVDGYQLHMVEGTQSVTHDLRVGGKIYARVIKGRNAYLGVFKDRDALVAAYPTPTVGQWAETIEEPNGQGGTGYLYICEKVEEEEVWVRKTAIAQGILYPATEERIQELEEKAVTYEAQSNKTSADKAQARTNIGAAALNGDSTEDFAAKDLTAAGSIISGNNAVVLNPSGFIECGEILTNGGDINTDGGDINTDGGDINLNGGNLSNMEKIVIPENGGDLEDNHNLTLSYDYDGLYIEDSNDGTHVLIPTMANGTVAMAENYYTKSVSDGRFAALNGNAQQDFAAKDLTAAVDIEATTGDIVAKAGDIVAEAGSIFADQNITTDGTLVVAEKITGRDDLEVSGNVQCGNISCEDIDCGAIQTNGENIDLDKGDITNAETVNATNLRLSKQQSGVEYAAVIDWDNQGLWIEDSSNGSAVGIPRGRSGIVALADDYYTKSVSDGRFAALNGSATQDFAAKNLTVSGNTSCANITASGYIVANGAIHAYDALEVEGVADFSGKVEVYGNFIAQNGAKIGINKTLKFLHATEGDLDLSRLYNAQTGIKGLGVLDMATGGNFVVIPTTKSGTVALVEDFVEITNAEIDNMDWT